MVRTADLPNLGAVTDDSTFVSDHAGTGAFSGSAVSTYIASKQRTLYFGYGPPVAAGLVGNGVADDGPAITAAFAAGPEVALPPGTYRISTNVTIPRDKRLTMAIGASLSVDSGKTVTFVGMLDAPTTVQLFSGAGSVVGIRQVYPEWWGAKGDGTGDDQPALAAAHTCVQGSRFSDGGRPTIFLTAAQYQVARTWRIVPSASINLAVIGDGTVFSGTRIIAATSFSPTGPVVWIDGSTGGTEPIADWEFRGIGILPATVGAGAADVGLQIGNTDPSYMLQGLQDSIVEDIWIGNFTHGLLVVHCRLIEFNRVSVWCDTMPGGGQCILIEQSGGFTGDMTFNDCQWVAQKVAGHTGLYISSPVGPFGTTPSAHHNIAGIRFNGCTGYNCDSYVRIDCIAGSHVNDIWFNAGCQFDGGAINSFFLNCDGTSLGIASQLQDIHLDHQYIDGATQAMVTVSTTNGAITRDVWITDNWLAQSAAAAVVVQGANNFGIHITGNNLMDCTATPFGGINVAGIVGGTILDNILTHSATASCAYLASVAANCDYMVVCNNSSAGITSTGIIQNLGATHSVFANNV